MKNNSQPFKKKRIKKKHLLLGTAILIVTLILSILLPDYEDPLAKAGPDQQVPSNTKVQLCATESSDNIKITSYTWSFYYDNIQQSLEGECIAFAFNLIGKYPVKLEVSDAAGNTASDTILINVIPQPYKKVLLNQFPVSLDLLFWKDNPAERNKILDSIKKGGTPFLVPYPNHFHLTHAPAAKKWYLYNNRQVPLSLPVDSYLVLDQWNLDQTTFIDGTEVYPDLSINLYLNYYIHFNLGHLWVKKSLIDELLTAKEINVFGIKRKAILIPANTLLGYTPDPKTKIYAWDFMVIDEHESNYPLEEIPSYAYEYAANPFFYFTESARNEISSYYQDQYHAMQESGLHLESSLTRTYNINEEGTLFGTWFYRRGPFILNNAHHEPFWYRFDGSILNIINIDTTDRETFYKDKNTGEIFGKDIIGVYGDADYLNVENYKLIGGRYLYLIEGNTFQGIVKLTEFFSNLRTGPIYMKFLLEPSKTSIYNDLLHVEYFNTLDEAKGSFTSNKITYIRFQQQY